MLYMRLPMGVLQELSMIRTVIDEQNFAVLLASRVPNKYFVIHE
jgi:hypothetical protein